MKVLYGILLILLIIFIIWIPGPFIWGLVSDYMEKREARNEVQDAALLLAEDYLETHYSDAVITELAMNTSAMSYGKPNRYAVAQYTSGDAAETLLIDTQSGQIWDSTDGEAMHEALTEFLETQLTLPGEYRMEAGWQILDYDEEANGGAFEEKGFFFVPEGCETAEELLQSVMLSVIIKYDGKAPEIDGQKVTSLYDAIPDCDASMQIAALEAENWKHLYEGEMLYKGYNDRSGMTQYSVLQDGTAKQTYPAK